MSQKWSKIGINHQFHWGFNLIFRGFIILFPYVAVRIFRGDQGFAAKGGTGLHGRDKDQMGGGHRVTLLNYFFIATLLVFSFLKPSPKDIG